MFYAVDRAGNRCEPSPGASAVCPSCGARMVAKCGQLVEHHWAHYRTADCDDWSGRDSGWRHEWVSAAREENREVVVNGRRADLLMPDGIVVVLQQGSLAAEMVAAKEVHFDRMVWLLDEREAYAKGNMLFRHGKTREYTTFRWKRARRSASYCKKPVFLDLGEGLVLWLKEIYPDSPVGGWGYFIDRQAFKNALGIGDSFQTLDWEDSEGRRLTNGLVVR